MKTDNFKPRELNLNEGPEAEFVRMFNWTCEEGFALSDLAVAALNTSDRMKERLRFKSPEEFRTWCNQTPGGELVDYPFPTEQETNAVKACIEHIRTCEICRAENDFDQTPYAEFMNPQLR